MVLSTLTLSPTTINGGQSTTATLTLTAAAPAGGILVSLAASSQSVVLPSINTINGPVQQYTVPAGDTSGTFKIGSIPVGSTQVVQITATYAGTQTLYATLILNSSNPLSLTAFTVNTPSFTSGSTIVGTVTLNAPAYSPGQQVFVASSDASVQPQNPVTVPTNSTTTEFSIFTSPVPAQRTVTVTATLNSTTISAQLTLLPTGTAITTLVVVPYTAAGGTNMTGIVTISPPAPSGGAVVALSAAFTDTATPSTTPLPITLPATVTVAAGTTQAQFTITTMTVTKTTDVTLTATLNSTGVTFVIAVVPSLTLAGISCPSIAVTTGDGIVCEVELNIPAPTGGQTVMLMSSNQTALALPASVVVPAGSSTQALSLLGGTVGNMPVPVTMTASLPNTSSGSVTNVLTVVPVNALNLTSFTLNASVVQGGTSPGGNLTANITIAPAGAPPGGLAISLSSSNPCVQFPNGPTVTVAQNSQIASFPITTTAVNAAVVVTITANVNAYPLTAQLTVVPGAQVVGLSISPTSVTGGNSVVGTVTLSVPAPQVGTEVALQSSSPDAELGATFTVTQGNTVGFFAITTLPVTTQQTATITASIGATSQQASFTITPVPPDLQLVFLNPATVTTGGTAVGTVVLTIPAPTGGVTVSLTSGSSDVTVPNSVTVPAGATSATFLVRAMSGITTITDVAVSGEVISSASKVLAILPVPTSTVTEQVVVSGETNSTDFKTSSGAFQTTLPSGDDTGFVTNIGLSTPVNTSTAYTYTFSTYLGGMSSFGQVRDVYVDSDENVYGCGVTADPNLPTTKNAAQSAFGGGDTDAFVAEFNSSGALQYLTYLGGSGDETCDSLTVDSSGNIYVAGNETDSTASGATNLMGTNGAFQTANAGGSDMFVAKINPVGANTAGRLVWLTFVGGAGNDYADGRIAIKANGDLIFSGTSQSTAEPPATGVFPIPAGQGRPPLNGVGTFGAVVEISSDGSTLVGSTLLFGHNNGPSPGTLTTTTGSGGLVLDAASNAYVCGQTNAADLVTANLTSSVAANEFQSTLLGQQESYIAILDSTGVFTAVTFVGGTDTSATPVQACKGIAVDHDMDPVIVQPTDAADYPITTGGTLSGPTDFGVTKLTNDLSAVIFSRLVGGSGTESADATRIQMDGAENMYFSLATNSPDFPVTASALQSTFAGTPLGTNTNVAVVKLSADGSTLIYSSYLGGSQNNSSTSIIYHLN